MEPKPSYDINIAVAGQSETRRHKVLTLCRRSYRCISNPFW